MSGDAYFAVMSESKVKEFKVNWWPLGIGVVVILAIWGLSGFAISHLHPNNPDSRGTFGDMFGAVNSLFSGLALATLIFAAKLQSDLLAIQRQEINDMKTHFLKC